MTLLAVSRGRRRRAAAVRSTPIRPAPTRCRSRSATRTPSSRRCSSSWPQPSFSRPMRPNTPSTDRIRFAGLSQRGQALVMTAMMLVVLFGMAGLAIDGGRAYWERRILQNAVDAAALAASDNYQDNTSISPALHAAANEYAANERIYTSASASPGWTSSTVDVTWPGAPDSVHIVVTTGTPTTFDVTSSHQIQLAFMQVLGVPSPITIGA